MRKNAILMPLFLLLAGCAQTLVSGPVVNLAVSDLQAAGQVAAASKDLLPVGDTWGECFTALSTTIQKIQAGPGLKTAGGGIFTEAVRVHVLRSLSQHVPAAVQSACGAVFMEVLFEAARALPGIP